VPAVLPHNGHQQWNRAATQKPVEGAMLPDQFILAGIDPGVDSEGNDKPIPRKFAFWILRQLKVREWMMPTDRAARRFWIRLTRKMWKALLAKPRKDHKLVDFQYRFGVREVRLKRKNIPTVAPFFAPTWKWGSEEFNNWLNASLCSPRPVPNLEKSDKWTEDPRSLFELKVWLGLVEPAHIIRKYRPVGFGPIWVPVFHICADRESCSCKHAKDWRGAHRGTWFKSKFERGWGLQVLEAQHWIAAGSEIGYYRSLGVTVPQLAQRFGKTQRSMERVFQEMCAVARGRIVESLERVIALLVALTASRSSRRISISWSSASQICESFNGHLKEEECVGANNER
jgi:hypothetical protein